MKTQDPSDVARVKAARQTFLTKHGIMLEDTTLVHITYDGDDYGRYHTIDDSEKGSGLIMPVTLESDALVVTKPNHALFLPLADCIGAVIHDPVSHVMMMSHLGRHNLEQHGGTKSLEYLVRTHGVKPENITVWLSPAAGTKNYPLFAFDNRSLHDVAVEQLEMAGVRHDKIEVSPIDVTTSPDYYSHSQFLKGKQDGDGRFAIAAVMPAW